jgi:hypothetical protein
MTPDDLGRILWEGRRRAVEYMRGEELRDWSRANRQTRALYCRIAMSFCAQLSSSGYLSRDVLSERRRGA